MSSDGDHALATQQSIKAYVDNKSCDIRSNIQELTVSGAVTPGVNAIELNHATVVVAATIADLADHIQVYWSLKTRAHPAPLPIQ